MTPLVLLYTSCHGGVFDPVTFWGTIGLVWAIMGLSAIVVARLWFRFAAFDSGLGCFAGCAVSLLGMTGWTVAMAYGIGSVLALAGWLIGALRTWPPSRPDDLVLGLGAAAGLGAICALAIESPPLRRRLWDHIDESARRTRVVLMTGLGLFGTLVIPSLGLLWVAYMYLTVGSCGDPGW